MKEPADTSQACAAMPVPTVLIGLDLAWGEKNRTGICILDEWGALKESASVQSDEEILKLVRDNEAPETLVGVDAPLVVPRQVRRRQCDSIISRALGARQAAAHTANWQQKAFENGGRALRLSEELKYSTDPYATGKRMIEVYPHASIVCLFELGCTLKYKAKRGRTVEYRQEQFRELLKQMVKVETLCPGVRFTDSGFWRCLRRQIEQASSQRALDVAEDELDAYVCAITGWLWNHRRSECELVGTRDHGYIVTPVDDNARSSIAAATASLSVDGTVHEPQVSALSPTDSRKPA